MKSMLAVLCTAVLLAACSTGDLNGKKADNYQGTVTRLAVAIRDAGRQGAEGNQRVPRGAADGAMLRAASDLRQSLPVRVPAAFSTAGVPATLVQATDEKTPRPRPAGTTHLLVVAIGGGSSTCSVGSCTAHVEIEARLFDARSGATAWTGEMTVSETGVAGAMAATVGDRLVAALRRDGLIR